MVVLPDHLPTIWTLPVGDADYPMRWSLIKAGFSRRIPKDERRNPSRIAKGERGIWQRGIREYVVVPELDTLITKQGYLDEACEIRDKNPTPKTSHAT